tara:strand:+ start:467 stop:1105 length:639 start_codon:yes stop_codon:yes gene_type:complete
MKKLHIIGTGGLAKELISYIESEKPKRYKIIGCWSDKNFNNEKYGKFYSGTIQSFKRHYKSNEAIIIAIANNEARKRLISDFETIKPLYETYIHQSCIISDFSKIGIGCILAPRVIICADAIVQDFVFMNTECVVGHDSLIESFSCLFPKVEICGDCHIEECCEFGINSIVLPGIRLKKSSKLDAMSVLRKNYDKSALYIGNPAKPVKLFDT